MTISYDELKDRLAMTQELIKANEKLAKLKSSKKSVIATNPKERALLWWTNKDWEVSKQNISLVLTTSKGEKTYEGMELKKGDETKVVVYTRGNSCLVPAWNK